MQYLICPRCQDPREYDQTLAGGGLSVPTCGSTLELVLGSSAGQAAPNGPRKVGKYELLGEVGSGGFGTVYRARDPELDRIVALKVLRAGSLADDQTRDRFLREGRSVAQLR